MLVGKLATMKSLSSGSAFAVATVFSAVAAVSIAVAALEQPDHRDIWSNNWVWVGVSLAAIALLLVLYALLTPKRYEEQGSWAGHAPGAKMRLTITEPALAVGGTTPYSDLEEWLRSPLGSDEQSHRLPLKGRVAPPPSGAEMRIRILTDKWYDQSVSFIDDSGYFNGTIYLNKKRPHARMELTVVSPEGIDLHTFYASMI
jgi:hypothetical protein